MPKVYDDNQKAYFDDLNVGDEFISIGRTITESDVVNYAAIIGWYDPLHCDDVYASRTVFRKRVVSGLLGLILSNGLSRGCFATTLGGAAILAFGGMKWEFKKPLFIGDTIHVRQNVKEKKESKKSDRGTVIFQVFIMNQNNEIVQEGEKVFILKAKAKEL